MICLKTFVSKVGLNPVLIVFELEAIQVQYPYPILHDEPSARPAIVDSRLVTLEVTELTLYGIDKKALIS